MRGLLDPNPGHRSEAEWRRLLGALIESLSRFTSIRFEPIWWIVQDDQAGYASACNCVDVRGAVNPALRLDACGSVGVTVNFGEIAWASCVLLLFSDGRRLRPVSGGDYLFLTFSEVGWSSCKWVGDDTGEWESHITDCRWNLGEPGAPADRPRD
jgi:hypothetical protein